MHSVSLVHQHTAFKDTNTILRITGTLHFQCNPRIMAITSANICHKCCTTHKVTWKSTQYILSISILSRWNAFSWLLVYHYVKPDIVAFTTATVMRHTKMPLHTKAQSVCAETKARQPMQQICQNTPEEIRWQMSDATHNPQQWYCVLLKHLVLVPSNQT